MSSSVPCTKCNATGIYRHLGRCFRCQGKGFQTGSDRRRNASYDRFRRRLASLAWSAGDGELAVTLVAYGR
jgi:hypothetical protein